MVHIKLAGGLGNQMFQYSFYKAFIKTNKNTKVKIDISWYFDKKRISLYKLNIFNNIKIKKPSNKFLIIKKYATKFRNLIYRVFNLFYIENDDGFDSNVININKGIIYGYFQNEKYFESVKDEVHDYFIFDIKEEEIIKLAKEMENTNSVSIHIRRGDYLKYPKRYEGICDLDYYEKAIEYMIKNVDNPVFYVFSNDIEWAKENIKYNNINYIDLSCYEKDWYDMYLMSNCKNNIIANSSFSWWAAYLNKNKNKIVISPCKWDNLLPNKNSCCSNWINV